MGQPLDANDYDAPNAEAPGQVWKLVQSIKEPPQNSFTYDGVYNLNSKLLIRFATTTIERNC